jgi:ABC-type multidrug transport system fused ATPase/permease subunit
MAQGDPLVLVLLRALYHGAKWTLKAASYTYWFPLYIIHRFVHATLDGSTPAWQTRAVSNPIIFWLTTPIRYFMGVVLFFPTILMYILAGVYCTHVYILRHEQSFFALGLDMELVSKLLTLLFFIILSSPGIANDKDIYKVWFDLPTDVFLESCRRICAPTCSNLYLCSQCCSVTLDVQSTKILLKFIYIKNTD